MRKIGLILLLSLVPLYGGMREIAFSELRNAGIYIKQVAPKVKESGSIRARNLLDKSIKQITQAKIFFERRNYQLCIIYAREARELASFAVKVAIGRVRTKEGLIMCKNSLSYLSSRKDVKKHYLEDLKNARSSLEKAYMFYNREEYKPALLEIRKCVTIMKGIVSHISTFSNIPEEAIKEKLRILRERLAQSKDKETIALYQRAEEEYRKGNYKLSLILVDAINRKLTGTQNGDRVLVESMEKKILTELKVVKLSEKQRSKVNKLLSEYQKAKQTGDYRKAKVILENIKNIISGK